MNPRTSKNNQDRPGSHPRGRAGAGSGVNGSRHSAADDLTEDKRPIERNEAHSRHNLNNGRASTSASRAAANPEQAQASGDADGPNPAELVRAIADEIGEHICFRDQWYKYQEGVFEPVDPHKYLPVVLDLLPEDKRLRRIADELMRTYEGLCQVESDGLRGVYSFGDSKESVLLNCANGVLQVTPAEVWLEEHSPEHRFTAKLQAAYDPNAMAERMNEAVHKFLPETADQELFFWWSGYAILPAIRVRHALACIGPTHSGKTTLWEFGICPVFPKRVLRALSLAEICNPNGYFVATLPGSALNLGGELTQSELLTSDKFKLLVGGEDVPARAIRGNPFTLSGYTTKFVFLGNHLPRFALGSDAEASRLRYLSFDQVSDKPDKAIQEEIKQERDGVFSRVMVPRLQRILAGDPCPEGSAKSRALHARFATLNDPFKEFVAQCCQLDRKASADKDMLARAYTQFCEDNDLHCCSKDVLMKVLRERYPQLTPGRENTSQGRNRVVKGIRLKKVVDRVRLNVE